jgi:hypothetical protein
METGTLDANADDQSLAEELALAIGDVSLPPMLRALMKAAQLELQAWYEGSSERGIAIARFALSEWHRWRLEAA